MSQKEVLACMFYQQTTFKNLEKIADTPTDEFLYGSVYTPDTNGKRPVMVWIHGGYWSVGCPEEYNATPIAGTGEFNQKLVSLVKYWYNKHRKQSHGRCRGSVPTI